MNVPAVCAINQVDFLLNSFFLKEIQAGPFLELEAKLN
jgi:hypothetical protein